MDLHMNPDIPPAEWDDLPLANRGEGEETASTEDVHSIGNPCEPPEPLRPELHEHIMVNDTDVTAAPAIDSNTAINNNTAIDNDENTGVFIDTRPSTSIPQELQRPPTTGCGSVIANDSPSLLTAIPVVETPASPPLLTAAAAASSAAPSAPAVGNGAACSPHLATTAMIAETPMAPPLLTPASILSAENLSTAVTPGSTGLTSPPAPLHPLLPPSMPPQPQPLPVTTIPQLPPEAMAMNHPHLRVDAATTISTPSAEIAVAPSTNQVTTYAPNGNGNPPILTSPMATAVTTATATIPIQISTLPITSTAGAGAAAGAVAEEGGSAAVTQTRAKTAKVPTGLCRAFAAGYCPCESISPEYCRHGLHNAAGAEEARRAWLAETAIESSSEWSNSGVCVGVDVRAKVGVPPVLLLVGELCLENVPSSLEYCSCVYTIGAQRERCFRSLELCTGWCS